MVLKDNYGCYNCEHFQEETLTADCKRVGFCSLDSSLQKRHFISSDNRKCQNYLPGIAISIYKTIKDCYNGTITKGELEKQYKNFSSSELDGLLETLIKQDYIISVKQDGIIYYLS